MNVRALLSLSCVVVIVHSVPLILRKIRPNRLYGFRTRKTLSKPEIWYPANRFAGWAMLAAGVVSLALLWLVPDEILLRPWGALSVFAGPLLAGLTASFLYLRRLS